MKYKIFIFEVSDEKKYEFVTEINMRKEELRDKFEGDFQDRLKQTIIQFEQKKTDILKG